ncbi:MAG: hypothetical protein JRJ29_12520 [Deltaproteobacteria bacterium]|nr:hypothetical protein [Deltaproteobacteria bacterium]
MYRKNNNWVKRALERVRTRSTSWHKTRLSYNKRSGSYTRRWSRHLEPYAGPYVKGLEEIFPAHKRFGHGKEVERQAGIYEGTVLQIPAGGEAKSFSLFLLSNSEKSNDFVGIFGLA